MTTLNGIAPTLHRTDCCSALMPLDFKVMSMQDSGEWIDQDKILKEKNWLIAHLPPSHICSVCRAAFSNPPTSPPHLTTSVQHLMEAPAYNP